MTNSVISLAERIGRIKPSPTVAVSAKAKELKAAGYNIANLGSGEPDFDTPQHIKDAATAAIAGGMTKYTAVDGTPELKKAIAEKFRRENSLDCSPKQIIVSAGAKHSLMNLMLAVLGPGDEVVIPAPYWVSYPDMSLLADATPVIIFTGAEQQYKISPAQLSEVLSEKTKVVVFNSPSNPSGALYSSDELAALGNILRDYPKIVIASDDIYEHIRYKGRPFANILNSCPDLAERTVIINGVSKAYAMTGWRIGYAAGPEKIIRAMTKIQSQMTTNPCSIAQAAAQAALEGGNECITPMLVAFDRRRRFMEKGLNDITGLNCPPIEGAFYAFPDAGEAIEKLHVAGKIGETNDVALCEYLIEKAGVAAVPGSAFGCPGCFRISFAAADVVLQDALDKITQALA
ncbi:MAG: pyridoxal phosphate-dependent aminotransferase [Candidatus Zeuxoniibacter abyssi]|nr:MAG: pyridoxal phosphate-dependent aminotransferase [Candidatus Persebacteraceae bacterium AB1(2)]